MLSDLCIYLSVVFLIASIIMRSNVMTTFNYSDYGVTWKRENNSMTFSWEELEAMKQEKRNERH